MKDTAYKTIVADSFEDMCVYLDGWGKSRYHMFIVDYGPAEEREGSFKWQVYMWIPGEKKYDYDPDLP